MLRSPSTSSQLVIKAPERTALACLSPSGSIQSLLCSKLSQDEAVNLKEGSRPADDSLDRVWAWEGDGAAGLAFENFFPNVAVAGNV